MGRKPQTALALRQSMPTPPRRLVDLAAGIGTVRHPGQEARYNLPEGMMLRREDRDAALAHLKSLTTALSADAPLEIDGRVFDGAEAKGALLTTMLRGLAGKSEPTPLEAAAKMEMYGGAVDDLPAWSVAAAIRRWQHGSCPAEIERDPDYRWPPAPAVLRKLAQIELDLPRRYRDLMQRLTAALPFATAMDPDFREVPGANMPALRRM